MVGLSKLRTKYESHEAKRILAGAYDLFVADERVIPSLPKLLGVLPGCNPDWGWFLIYDGVTARIWCVARRLPTFCNTTGPGLLVLSVRP